MTPTVSLPMYNLPEMRADNARFWEALRELLVEAGLRDLPERLTFDRLPVPERIGPEVFFSQTCGYPLETIFSGQAIRLGTPCYAVPGCDGPTHCGLFVVGGHRVASIAASTRSGVNGICVTLTPTASSIALAIAAATPSMPLSPMPLAPNGPGPPCSRTNDS